MNEQENLRLVQEIYESMRVGDTTALLNALADGARWQLPEMENVPFAGTWEGREGVEQFFGEVFSSQDVVAFEPEEFVAKGEKVIVLGNFTMRIKATQKDFSSAWAHVWTVIDGQVAHFYEYVDTAVVSRAYTAAKAA